MFKKLLKEVDFYLCLCVFFRFIIYLFIMKWYKLMYHK